MSQFDPDESQNLPAQQDSMWGAEQVRNQFLSNTNRTGKPLSAAPLPKIFKRVNPVLWPQLDVKAYQLLEQTRWMWAKEWFDGAGPYGWEGVGRPVKQQPYICEGNYARRGFAVFPNKELK